MTEKLDLGQGDWAEVNSDLGYSDRRWWRIEVDKVKRAKGVGVASKYEPDPDNPAVMREVPGSAIELTMEDNLGLIEVLTEKLVTESSVPGLVPCTPDAMEALSHSHGLEACDKIEDAVIEQMNRLNGIAAPKQAASGDGSATGSSDTLSTPLPEPMPGPSSTPSA